MDGNLSVSKSLVIFYSTEVDHTLKKENMTMKIQGEIKGNNKSALKEHFLIPCEIRQITEAFLESLHLNSAKINIEDYYQLTGLGKLTRELQKVLKC